MILRILTRCRLDRAAIFLLLLIGSAIPARAHDIPARVAAFIFVKPAGRTLTIALRVPLESMRDVNFPTRGPGFIDAPRAQPLLNEAVGLWIVDNLAFYENGERLPEAKIAATRISIPNDRAFTSFERAMSHIVSDAALGDSVELPWQQAMLDVVLTLPITLATSTFAVEPQLSGLGLRTSTVMHFLPANGSERVFEYEGNPGRIALDPSWVDAARRFVVMGIEHILSGIDHLLFVLCLVIPVRRVRTIVGIVTAFTVAHSMTLIAAALGLAPTAAWFPPFIEVMIAVSIVYMALENMVARPAVFERRWMVAFGFGLVHGFAFSFALQDAMQFAGSHLLAALLTFNVGVEIGQLFVIILAVPLLAVFFRRVVTERAGVIMLSALVAHTAWHWMLDRGSVLGQYKFEWPAFDLALAAGALRAAMLLIIIGVVAWVMSKVVNSKLQIPRLRSE